METTNFSARSLQYILVKNIGRQAKVTSNLCRVYGPISNAYNIDQIESKGGTNFKALHTMINQIKSCIHKTYSWVNKLNINSYFNEFCFRINRSLSNKIIFKNLITKMVKADKIYQK